MDYTEKLNDFFSFDEKEFFTSIVIVGDKKEPKKDTIKWNPDQRQGSIFLVRRRNLWL